MNFIYRLGLLLFSLLPLGYFVLGSIRLFNLHEQLRLERLAIESTFLLIAAVMTAACWAAIRKLSQTVTYLRPAHIQRLELKQPWLGKAFGMTLLLGAIGFVGFAAYTAGQWLVMAASVTVVAAISGALLLLLSESLVSEPTLRIDERGLFHIRYGLIRWADIIGLRRDDTITHGRRTSALVVGVNQPHQYIAKAHWLIRKFRGSLIRKKPGHGVFFLPISGMTVPPELVEDTARHFRSTVQPPMIEHWHEALDDQDLFDRRRQAEILANLQALATRPDTHLVTTDESIAQKLEVDMQELEEIAKRTRKALDSRMKHAKRSFFWVAGFATMLLIFVLTRF